MRELGNVIECYRGEAFAIDRSFVDGDRAPLYIPQGIVNPYLKVSVHSNTYRMNGEYRKNYWLDLSDMPQYKGYKQFDDNEVPLTGVAVDLLNDNDSISVSIEGATFTTSIGISDNYELGESVNLTIQSTPDVPIPANTPIRVTIPCDINKSELSILITSFNMSKVYFGASEELPDDSLFTTVSELTSNNYKLQASITSQTSQLYIWYYLDSATTASTITFTNIEYVNYFDNDYIGYIITNDGREYYVLSGNNYTRYSFNVLKLFLNNDTRDWISGIYKYDMTICSGQLMVDWLTRNFKSLYPGVTPPQANVDLAHYICKKDKHLLDNVDITEPLVSYKINTVLLGPTKLIVKEA